MALGANSYGSTAKIATFCPKWVDQTTGAFNTSTKPTLAQVEGFCDDVSAMLNVMLAQAHFSIPVTQADVKLALGVFVNDEVVALVEGLHGSGRFGPTTKQPGKPRSTILSEDIQAWITANITGIEALGVVRSGGITSGIAYRDGDNAGNDVAPIFQRDGFSNQFDDADPV